MAVMLANITIFLRRKKELRNDALTFAGAMKIIFSALDYWADHFEDDYNIITRKMEREAEAEYFAKEVSALYDAGKEIEKGATSPKITDYLSRVSALDSKIKSLDMGPEHKTVLRERLCKMGRNVATALHDEKGQIEYASMIIDALREEFSDIPTLLRLELLTESGSLHMQLVNKLMAEVEKRQKRSRNLIRLVVVVIFAVLTLIACVGGCSSRSDPAETEYFASTAVSGDKVYADIVSIVPKYGICTPGSSSFSSFVCQCKTSFGSTVWVYMPCTEYKEHFDFSVSTDASSKPQAEKVTFSSAKRIHGTVKTADSIQSDLSSTTGQYVIDFSSLGQ